MTRTNYTIDGKIYTIDEIREFYKTITGIAYNDLSCYDRALTDKEIYQYLLDTLKD